METNIKDWISAMRLRTLALSLACISMGSFLAYFYEAFDGMVLLFSLLTTTALQILSNFANDYGDSMHGADNAERKGPSRAVQSGRIAKKGMKNAIIFLAFISVVLGSVLLILAPISRFSYYIFLGLGLIAIMAAINYTMGKRPYGYLGYGDFAVFVFFGLLAVIGTFYLHTSSFKWEIILPAVSCGLLAVGVLNVNNIRDIESDALAGKKSVAVKLGRKKAILYHYLLLSFAVITAIVFVLLQYHSIVQFLFLLTVPLLVKNALGVGKYKEQMQLDPYLKQLAISTLIFVLLFGTGLILAV